MRSWGEGRVPSESVSRNERVSRGGLGGGVGLSLLAHIIAVLLMLFLPWLMPSPPTEPPLFTVSLVSLAEFGGGEPEGEEGLKGGGEPQPEEPEVHASVQLLTPPKPVPEKPKPDPRPKPKPAPVPKAVRTPPSRAREEATPSAHSQVEGGAAASDARATGSGGGEGEGVGKGSAGSGLGAGSGSGSGAGQGPLDATFGSGDGPRFLKKAQVKYPRIARELGKEGTVVLRLTIDERGRLVSVDVIKPGGAGFDEEAVRAVKASSFSPAVRNGRPILCRAHLPIRFVLREGE